jgi:hypothetical protein
MVVFDDVAAGPTCQWWAPTVFLLPHITFNNPLYLPPNVTGLLRLLSPSVSLPDLPPVARRPPSGSGGMSGGRRGAVAPLHHGRSFTPATSKVRPRGRSKVPGGACEGIRLRSATGAATLPSSHASSLPTPASASTGRPRWPPSSRAPPYPSLTGAGAALAFHI